VRSEEVSDPRGAEINAAAATLKQWAKKLEGVIRAADVLEQVGSLSNAADEANARIAVAQEKEGALAERLAALDAEVKEAEVKLASRGDVDRQVEDGRKLLVLIEESVAAAKVRRDELAAETAELEGRAEAARAALDALHAQFAGS
jgi:chromosome segregation ATPase